MMSGTCLLANACSFSAAALDCVFYEGEAWGSFAHNGLLRTQHKASGFTYI